MPLTFRSVLGGLGRWLGRQVHQATGSSADHDLERILLGRVVGRLAENTTDARADLWNWWERVRGRLEAEIAQGNATASGTLMRANQAFRELCGQ